MKKVRQAILPILLAAAGGLYADASDRTTVQLEAAGFRDWMALYLASSLDARSVGAFGISTSVEPAPDGRYRILIEGYVNLDTDAGLAYVRTVLPERLGLVKRYFGFWSSLGYDVEFSRDVELDVRNVTNVATLGAGKR
jgi:hypothetical protein